jgi:sporulation protein YlmC with PRC-barrel domain
VTTHVRRALAREHRVPGAAVPDQRRAAAARRWHLTLYMKISDDSLRGRVVLSSDGLAIGEIERFFVDPANLRVASLEVKLRKEAADRVGVHRSLFHAATLEISSTLVQSTGDVVILSVPLDALRQPAGHQAAAKPPQSTQPAPATPRH